MKAGNEQQYQAEVMAELEQQEADADWLAWLDRVMDNRETEHADS